MTPEERQLIAGLFDRMRSYGSPEKDREALAMITEAMRTVPDAPYMLVQLVLAQEHALQEAGTRIQELEQQVRNAEGSATRPQPGSGSFLGGLLGGGRPASQPTGTSVPPVASRAVPSTQDDDRRPWTQSPPGQPGAQPMAAEPASGGFLRSAMATAAGVAGGVLAAGAIRDLLGGNSAAHAANAPPNPQPKNDAAVQQARQDWEDDVRADAADEGSFDDGGDTGEF
jgi:uncharacterized protein